MLLLVRAVTEMRNSHRRTAAAGVSAKMRQLDPDFRYGDAGFATFRELVEHAQRLGQIAATDAGSDLDLQLASETTLRRLSDDVWRAFLDWDQTRVKSFDRATRKVTARPTADSVSLDAISRDEQIGWMEGFARSLPGDTDRDGLLEALQRSGDPRDFFATLRKNRPVDRQWRLYLQQRVLDRASSWARTNGIPLADLDDGTRNQRAPRPEASRTDAVPEDSQARLRAEILAILGSMPVSELLKLPIPVEYALRT